MALDKREKNINVLSPQREWWSIILFHPDITSLGDASLPGPCSLCSILVRMQWQIDLRLFYALLPSLSERQEEEENIPQPFFCLVLFNGHLIIMLGWERVERGSGEYDNRGRIWIFDIDQCTRRVSNSNKANDTFVRWKSFLLLLNGPWGQKSIFKFGQCRQIARASPSVLHKTYPSKKTNSINHCACTCGLVFPPLTQNYLATTTDRWHEPWFMNSKFLRRESSHQLKGISSFWSSKHLIQSIRPANSMREFSFLLLSANNSRWSTSNTLRPSCWQQDNNLLNSLVSTHAVPVHQLSSFNARWSNTTILLENCLQLARSYVWNLEILLSACLPLSNCSKLCLEKRLKIHLLSPLFFARWHWTCSWR